MTAPVDPNALSASEAAFVAVYEATGNATRAYFESHPLCISANAAGVGGYHLLRKPKVAAHLLAIRTARLKLWEMSADESVALIGAVARADIGELYDADGKLLPIGSWPDYMRLAVKSIRGDGTVVLHDGLRARELVAVMTGKLRNKLDVNHTFDLAKYLAEDPVPKG